MPEIGRVTIKVEPDTDGFRERTKAEVEKETAGLDKSGKKTPKVAVDPKVDKTKAKQVGEEAAEETVEAFLKRLRGLNKGRFLGPGLEAFVRNQLDRTDKIIHNSRIDRTMGDMLKKLEAPTKVNSKRLGQIVTGEIKKAFADQKLLDLDKALDKLGPATTKNGKRVFDPTAVNMKDAQRNLNELNKEIIRQDDEMYKQLLALREKRMDPWQRAMRDKIQQSINSLDIETPLTKGGERFRRRMQPQLKALVESMGEDLSKMSEDQALAWRRAMSFQYEALRKEHDKFTLFGSDKGFVERYRSSRIGGFGRRGIAGLVVQPFFTLAKVFASGMGALFAPMLAQLAAMGGIAATVAGLMVKLGRLGGPIGAAAVSVAKLAGVIYVLSFVASGILPLIALVQGSLLTLPGILGGIGVAAAAIAFGAKGIKKAAVEVLQDDIERVSQTYSAKFYQALIAPFRRVEPLLAKFEQQSDHLVGSIVGVFESLLSGIDGDSGRYPGGANGENWLDRLTANTGFGLQAISPGIEKLFAALGKLAGAFSGKFASLGSGFSKSMDEFNGWVDKIVGNGQFDTAMNTVGMMFQHIGRAIGNILDVGWDYLTDPAKIAQVQRFMHRLEVVIQWIVKGLQGLMNVFTWAERLLFGGSSITDRLGLTSGGANSSQDWNDIGEAIVSQYETTTDTTQVFNANLEDMGSQTDAAAAGLLNKAGQQFGPGGVDTGESPREVAPGVDPRTPDWTGDGVINADDVTLEANNPLNLTPEQIGKRELPDGTLLPKVTAKDLGIPEGQKLTDEQIDRLVAHLSPLSRINEWGQNIKSAREEARDQFIEANKHLKPQYAGVADQNGIIPGLFKAVEIGIGHAILGLNTDPSKRGGFGDYVDAFKDPTKDTAWDEVVNDLRHLRDLAFTGSVFDNGDTGWLVPGALESAGLFQGSIFGDEGSFVGDIGDMFARVFSSGFDQPPPIAAAEFGGINMASTEKPIEGLMNGDQIPPLTVPVQPSLPEGLSQSDPLALGNMLPSAPAAPTLPEPKANFDGVVGEAKDATTEVVGEFRETGPQLSSTAQGWGPPVVGAVQAIGPQLQAAGRESGKLAGVGLIQGMQAMIQPVKVAAAMLGNAAAVGAASPAGLAEKSPSKKMRDIGERAGQGLILGLEGFGPQVVDRAANLAASIAGQFDEGFVDVGDKMKDNLKLTSKELSLYIKQLQARKDAGDESVIPELKHARDVKKQLQLQKERVGLARDYHEENDKSNDLMNEMTSNMQDAVSAGYSFATANRDQFLQDLGFSGSGSLPGALDQGVGMLPELGRWSGRLGSGSDDGRFDCYQREQH